MAHPNNADPLSQIPNAQSLTQSLGTSALAPVLIELINRIEIHTRIIRQNAAPHMQQFDRGQLYAIEKVLEFLYEELREGSL